MASSAWCQNQHGNMNNPSSKGKKNQNSSSSSSSVIPKRFCDFVFRRNVDNRVYRSESFRFIQKTDSFVAAGAARRSLKVPVIENYIDPVDHQLVGKEEPSYHEIVERYNAPYYYSDTIKEAVEPPYCSPCPTRKTNYNCYRGNSRGQIVRKCNSESVLKSPYNKNEDFSSQKKQLERQQRRRSSPHPLDVDKLLDPIKSTSLEAAAADDDDDADGDNDDDDDSCFEPTSPPPPITCLPPQRNQFISICHILNSPNATLENVSVSSVPLPPTSAVVVPTNLEDVQKNVRTPFLGYGVSDLGNHHNVTCNNKNISLNSSNSNNNKPSTPITHKYLKASVVRDKRLQKLKSSRSINSLDSDDFLKSSGNNDDRRSLCGYEHNDDNCCGSSSSNSSGSRSTKSNSNNTQTSAISSVVDTSCSSGYFTPPPYCDSLEYSRHHHHHEVSLPNLQTVGEPDEFHINFKPAPWVDSNISSNATTRQLSHLLLVDHSHEHERQRRPVSRKSQVLSRQSCDNSSISTTNSGSSSGSSSCRGSSGSGPRFTYVSIPSHLYTPLQGSADMGVDRLSEICYADQSNNNNNSNNILKKHVKMDGSSPILEPGSCNMKCRELLHFRNLPSYAHHKSDDHLKSAAAEAQCHHDINYVKPQRFWDSNNASTKFSVRQYQVKVDAPLESQEWFHGAITRLESESILEPTKPGSFLVRNCENSAMNHFSLSIKCSRGFIHIRIEPNSRGTYVLAEQEFSSVPYLINHFILNRLPIKGAEHVKLMYPVITQFL